MAIFGDVFRRLLNFLKQESRSRFVIIFLLTFLVVSIAVSYFSKIIFFSTTAKVVSESLLLLSFVVSATATYVFSRSMRELVSKNKELLAVLSLALTIMIFSFEVARNEFQKTFEAEDAIKQANTTNYDITSMLFEVGQTDPLGRLIDKFDSAKYVLYWSYIPKNYAYECRDKYIKIITTINQYNSIESERTQIALLSLQLSDVPSKMNVVKKIDAEYANLLFEFASTTRANLSYVMNYCQDFKQR